MKNITKILVCGVAIASILGCGGEQHTQAPAEAVDGSAYALTIEPTEAKTVIAARAECMDGDEVVLIGRIGGSVNPWIDGRAAFSVVDESLRACSDIPGDKCSKPWAYCCETDKLPTATALIKVVDEQGKLVAADAKSLLGVKELSTVVVQGKAQRDDAGNLTVLASGIFIKKK